MARAPLHAVLQHLYRLAGTPGAAGLADKLLLQRFAADRDESAFSTLVQRHGSLVMGVCRRLLRHEQDAEDAFQATFLVLARKAGSVRWRPSVAGWLYQVAYRLAAEARAKIARRRAREKEAGAIPRAESRPETPLRELGAALDEELQRLPEPYRQPLLLCYLEGQTRDRAAMHLGWSLRTLERRLQRGRELLRARLTRRGLTLSAGLLAAGLVPETAGGPVPALLAASTVKAATVFAAGKEAAALSTGLLSAKVTSLAEGALRTMLISKLKVAVGLALALTMIGAGVGTVVQQTRAAKPQPASQGRESEPSATAAERPQDEKEKPQGTRRAGSAQRERKDQAQRAAGKLANDLPAARARRMVRWMIDFDTHDGKAYVEQLQALGAVLALPDPHNRGQYRIIRDLDRRPARPEAEKLARIRKSRHVFWVDDDRASVARLAKALGLQPPPEYVAAFLPQYIEDELLRKELAHAGCKEEDISETRFRVLRTATGYDLQVVSQQLKDSSGTTDRKQENQRLKQRLRKVEEELERLHKEVEAVKKAADRDVPGKK